MITVASQRMPLLRLLTDPLHASGTTDVKASSAPCAVQNRPESARLPIMRVA